MSKILFLTHITGILVLLDVKSNFKEEELVPYQAHSTFPLFSLPSSA